MAVAYLGLGSNLGDRVRHLRQAADLLTGLGPAAISPWYETRPVRVGGGMFLNAAMLVAGQSDPRATMRGLQRIERRLGRTRREPGGARTIDIDLLLFDGLVSSDPAMTIPHPRMHERPFVLVPLADIAPEARHPLLGQSIRALLQRVGRAGVQRWSAA